MRRRVRRGVTSAVVTCWLVLSVSAAMAAPPSASTALDTPLTVKAHVALAQGDRHAAADALRVAAMSEPMASTWTLLGDVEMNLERPDAAVKAWESALDLQPESPEVLDRLARHASVIGDWSRATELESKLVAHLAEVAEVNPKVRHFDLVFGRRVPVGISHRRHLAVLSELAVLAGDFTTAESSARALVRLNPKAVDGHLALGYLHLHANEFAEAIDAYETVLALDPQNPTALNNLGGAYYMERDLDTAGEHYERVLESGVVNAYGESIALANLAELAQLRGTYSDADYLYTQAIEALPAGAWSYMGRAALLDLMGSYDEAVDTMIDGWERDGNRLTRLNMHFFQPEWAWQRDALIAEIEGDVDLAEALWQKVLHGEVVELHRSAADHLEALSLD